MTMIVEARIISQVIIFTMLFRINDTKERHHRKTH